MRMQAFSRIANGVRNGVRPPIPDGRPARADRRKGPGRIPVRQLEGRAESASRHGKWLLCCFRGWWLVVEPLNTKVWRGRFLWVCFSTRNTTEESALVEERIQAIAERRRHDGRGRVVGRLPATRRARPGGARQVREGSVALARAAGERPRDTTTAGAGEAGGTRTSVASASSFPARSRE